MLLANVSDSTLILGPTFPPYGRQMLKDTQCKTLCGMSNALKLFEKRSVCIPQRVQGEMEGLLSIHHVRIQILIVLRKSQGHPVHNITATASLINIWRKR